MPHGGVMDDHFYVMSGRAGMFTIYSDVWRSRDGRCPSGEWHGYF